MSGQLPVIIRWRVSADLDGQAAEKASKRAAKQARLVLPTGLTS